MELDIDIQELIVQVRLRPDLYDPGAPDYRNRNRKRDLWKEVCDALCPALDTWDLNVKNAYGREVQKKWNSLRDCFRRELNYQLKAPPGKKKTKYKLYDQLLFLAPYSHITNDEAYAGPAQMLKQSLGSEAEFNEERTNWTRTAETLDADRSKRFKSTETLAALKESGRLVKEMGQRKTKHLDDDEAFLMSLLPSFKNCSMEEKFALRIELMQTIVRFKQQTGPEAEVEVRVKSEMEDRDFEEDNPLGD